MPTYIQQRAGASVPDQERAERLRLAENAEFQKGDIVKVTSGRVNKLSSGGAGATALAVAVHNVPDDEYRGQQREASVVKFTDEFELEMSYNGTIAQADIGATKDIAVVSGIPVVGSTATNAAVVIQRLADKYAIGDVNPRVVVRVLPAARF